MISNENSIDDTSILENETTEIVSDVDSKQQKNKSGKNHKKEKVRPQLVDEEIERMILKNVFKVKIDS